MNEVWKDVIGYEDIYIVSNLGKIKNKKTDKLLNGYINKDGYTVITLTKDGERKYKYLHRLVAIHFIDNPENKPEVDHIIPISDGGTNCVYNLRWATPKENTNNPISKKKSDESKKGRKPTDKQIEMCKKVLIKDKVVGINDNNEIIVFESSEEAKRNGFHHVSDCCRKIRKRSGGYEWFYLNECPPHIKKQLKE